MTASQAVDAGPIPASRTMRESLDEIIQSNQGDNWWKPGPFEECVRPHLPGELEIIQGPPPAEENFNCFIYVLGLHNEENVLKETGGFLYDTFFQKLLRERVLRRTDTPKDGDYIMYRDLENYPDMITHVGVLDGGLIVSKWAWGPLIRHRILDVPQSYGDDISYAKAVSPARAKELYKQYKKYNSKPAAVPSSEK